MTYEKFTMDIGWMSYSFMGNTFMLSVSYKIDDAGTSAGRQQDKYSLKTEPKSKPKNIDKSDDRIPGDIEGQKKSLKRQSWICRRPKMRTILRAPQN